MLKIAVLASGGGSNFQAIINAIQANELSAKIAMLIVDRECRATKRADIAQIPAFLVDRRIEKSNLSTKIDELISTDCDLIVLAGFLSILNSEFISKWRNKIINIHPSLLPKFGGSGMWGMNVHNAVIAAGEHKSGCSVHYVSEEIDGGQIILQTEVDVLANDTPESLQQKVLAVEHDTLIAAIKKFTLC